MLYINIPATATKAQILTGIENTGIFYERLLLEKYHFSTSSYSYTVRTEKGDIVERKFPFLEDEIRTVTYLTETGLKATAKASDYKELLEKTEKPMMTLQLLAKLELAKQLLGVEVEKSIRFDSLEISWYSYEGPELPEIEVCYEDF